MVYAKKIFAILPKKMYLQGAQNYNLFWRSITKSFAQATFKDVKNVSLYLEQTKSSEYSLFA